jgi:glycosyltransferase involved in cell wall biosynthesis
VPLKIWIVCPCFFDVPSFLRVRETAVASLQASNPGSTVSFVVVDDSAGRDPEVDIRLGPLAGVTVIRPPRNLGHQGALVHGLRRAGPSIAAEDVVVTMDSDGEDRPEDIAVLIAPLLNPSRPPGLVAVARRTKRTETPLFQLFYLCFKVCFRIATGTVIRSGNFVAYRGWLLGETIHHPYFDRCYSSTFISLPLDLAMVPLPRGRRYAGASKMGTWGLFVHGLRMLLPFTERIAVRAVFLFSALALALAVFLAAASRGLFPPRRPAPLLGAWIGLGVFLLLVAASAFVVARGRREARIRLQGSPKARPTSASVR